MNVGSVVSALVANKRKGILIVVIVVGAPIGGAFAIGVFGVPSVAAIDNTFGDVTDETTSIETDLVISNPNPVGIGLEGVSVTYTLSMNSIEMAYGDRDGIEVGSGNSSLDLETTMENDAIPPWWTSHIQNGEHTVIEIDATITSDLLGRSTDVHHTHEVTTDLIGAFDSNETRPVNAESPLADDPVLYINETRGAWGAVSETETPIDMEFVVYNPNLEPYAITRLRYAITMNDVEMGDGETHREHIIPSQSTETVPLTTTISNQRLDDWWVTHLNEDIHGHQVSELRIELYAVIELPTGEAITVPLEELTYEEVIGTDIFDEGGDVGKQIETDADGSGDRDETDADGNGSDADTNGDDPGDDDTDDGTNGDHEDDGNEENGEDQENGEDDIGGLLQIGLQ